MENENRVKSLPPYLALICTRPHTGQSRLLQMQLLLTQHFLAPAAEKFDDAEIFPRPAIRLR